MIMILGAAGTAKTSTVIATYAEAARAQGLTVRAFAPTSAAAKLLGRAIDTGGGRIVQHPEDDIRRVYIARDLAALFRKDRAATLVLDPTARAARGSPTPSGSRC